MLVGTTILTGGHNNSLWRPRLYELVCDDEAKRQNNGRKTPGAGSITKALPKALQILVHKLYVDTLIGTIPSYRYLR